MRFPSLGYFDTLAETQCRIDLFIVSPQAVGWFPVGPPFELELHKALKAAKRWQGAIMKSDAAAVARNACGVRVRLVSAKVQRSNPSSELWREVVRVEETFVLWAFAQQGIDSAAPAGTIAVPPPRPYKRRKGALRRTATVNTLKAVSK